MSAQREKTIIEMDHDMRLYGKAMKGASNEEKEKRMSSLGELEHRENVNELNTDLCKPKPKIAICDLNA